MEAGSTFTGGWGKGQASHGVMKGEVHRISSILQVTYIVVNVVDYVWFLIIVGEEHAVQMDLIVCTRIHSRNIYSKQYPENKSFSIHIYFSLEVKMVEILTDLNWK